LRPAHPVAVRRTGRPDLAKRSAGLLLCRRVAGGLEVLLAHPGGPFWARRDAGAWSIPKGEYADDEEPERAARREFAEETGSEAPDGPMIDLGEIRQKAGKVVRAFASLGTFDPATLRSNAVEIAWPPRSGRRMLVPEIDRVAWFDLDEAARRILDAQRPFLDRAALALAADP
jgi:predicted NUDIX family NTP pyrophosphohydrolase